MSLTHLAGSTYGPFPVRVSAEQVAAYVAVTRDDPRRWLEHAPPSFAGALLFAAAPAFLGADEVKPYTKLLVHADQSFTWHRALVVDETVSVDGLLSRIRERSGTSFVTFMSTVRSGDEAVVESVSTFLMGTGAPTTEVEDEPEPSVDAAGPCDPLPDGPELREGSIGEVSRSASRLDLVRYAAASGDFNPVHFDHATARRAGFPGVLVHGLLMGAWLLQTAAAYSARPDPVAEARLRFRNPLRPNATTTVGGTIEEASGEGAAVRLTLRGPETEYVQAAIRLRTG